MALFYQSIIDANTRLAIWHIQEKEAFFLRKVQLKSPIAHPHKRLQHLAGRYLLQHLFPAFPHTEIEITASKKPVLADDTYHFSISHSGDFAAAIVSSSLNVGIDIEIFSDKAVKVKHKFLSEEELNFTNKSSNDTKLLTTLWSAKEAIYKWYGMGKISLRENILLQPFLFEKENFIAAHLLSKNKDTFLIPQYKLFEELSLSWVTSPKKYPAKDGI